MDYESSYVVNHTLGMFLGCQEHRELKIWGMNGVAVARYGLILGQNGTTDSRKVSRYLPDPWDIIKKSKTTKRPKSLKHRVFHIC